MDSVKFFELVRNSSYAIAFCILLPFFAHYTSRLFIGSATPNYWKLKNAISSQISMMREKENTLTKELSKKHTEQGAAQLSEAKKEIEELSAKLAAQEAEQKSDEIRRGRITFYVAAIVGLLSMLFGMMTKASYLAAGATLGGTLCLVVGFSSNWGQINDLLKVLSLFIALLIIVATSFQMSKRV